MSSSDEFLGRIKSHFRYAPIIEGLEKSEEFSQLTRAEFESFENSVKKKLENFDVESDYLVEQLVNEVMPVLNSSESEMAANVAFGKLYNTKMNAFCAKSKDGFDSYCIVINEGLLMLLHKYGKLLSARSNPRNVLFCNREEAAKIDSETYAQWSIELISNY